MLNNHFRYTLVTPPVELAVADSGCTSHFLSATCSCDNKVSVVHGGKCLRMPNGETMVATHTPLLPFPQPPLAPRKCDVLPELQQTLLYLRQFCDAGFTANLTSETVLLTKYGRTTLAGTRDHSNALYFIPLQGYPNSTLPPPYLQLLNQTRQHSPVQPTHTPKPMYFPTVHTT